MTPPKVYETIQIASNRVTLSAGQVIQTAITTDAGSISTFIASTQYLYLQIFISLKHVHTLYPETTTEIKLKVKACKVVGLNKGTFDKSSPLIY